MMAAEVRQVAHRLKRILGVDEQPGTEALKAAEDLQNVLTVVSDRHRLAVGADILELLDDHPALGIHHARTAVGRLGIEYRDKHLAAVHREAQMEGAGIVPDPTRVLDVGNLLPVARVPVRGVIDGHVVLLDVVHHGEELAVGCEPRLVAHALEVVELDFPGVGIGRDLFDRQVAGRPFGVVQAAYRLPILAIQDHRRRAHPDD